MKQAVAQERTATAEVFSPHVSRGSSIPELSSEERHFEAVAKYVASEPSALALSDRLAVSRSAWALGLVNMSRTASDDAFADVTLTAKERAQLKLARAILELQEGRFEEARVIAEREVQKLEPSSLRAQFLLVIGESLKEQGVLSKAEDYYKKSVEEAKGEERYEARFLLGDCQFRLGRAEDARKTLVQIAADSRYAPHALLRLVELDFQQKDYEKVLTWIAEGVKNFPSEFDDPWVHYAHIISSLQKSDIERAKKLLAEFRNRHSGENRWVALADAAVEHVLAQDILLPENNGKKRASL